VATERERVRFVRASKLYHLPSRERTMAYRLLERPPQGEESEG
jgi:hypothetical protein